MRIPVHTNVCDIPERIKAIDNGYFVMYNSDIDKYEVHHHAQPNTLALTLPYEALDSRAVDLVQKTRIQNRDRIIAEMDAYNDYLELNSQKGYLDEANQKTKDIFKYCMNHESKDTVDTGAFTTKFI